MYDYVILDYERTLYYDGTAFSVQAYNTISTYSDIQREIYIADLYKHSGTVWCDLTINTDGICTYPTLTIPQLETLLVNDLLLNRHYTFPCELQLTTG